MTQLSKDKEIVVPFVVIISDTSSTRTKMAASGYHLNRLLMVPWLASLQEQGAFTDTTSLPNFLGSPHG